MKKDRPQFSSRMDVFLVETLYFKSVHFKHFCINHGSGPKVGIKGFLRLSFSWVLTLKKPRTSQESVLCTKCSISYIISHQPLRGVYRETSSFSVIYAGKIAFFTFGHFMGSNFEKTKNQSRVRFMYEMQHFVHNFPPAERPKRGLPRDF